MKNLKITLILLAILVSCFAGAATPTWEKIESFGVEAAYKNISDPSAIITIVKKEDNNEFKLNDFDLNTYVKALPETRQFMHNLIGISNWTITRFEKKNFLSGTQRVLMVKLLGHYTRNKTTTVEFEEWHHFYDQTFLQIQLIRNQDNASNADDEAFASLQSKWL